MKDVTIYHNPRCSKSRQTLQIIKDHGIQPIVVEYLKEPLKKPCTYPSYMFFVDYNGDVLMCSHDWGKKLILGNLNKNSFSEIWKGKKSMFARNKLNKSNFTSNKKCFKDG